MGTQDDKAMISFNWRLWFRILHRDLGYFFFGATVIYAVSGLTLNHRNHWNSNYSVSRQEITVKAPEEGSKFTKEVAKDLLAEIGVKNAYQSHYSPGPGQIKVFFEGGNAVLERSTGKIVLETLHKRPLLNTFNQLHRTSAWWWLWFSDLFSMALLILAITGLFLLRGRNGITRRGGVLVLLGIAVPTILVLAYL